MTRNYGYGCEPHMQITLTWTFDITLWLETMAMDVNHTYRLHLHGHLTLHYG